MKTFKLDDAQALTVLLALSTARGVLDDDTDIREAQEALRQQWNEKESTDIREGVKSKTSRRGECGGCNLCRHEKGL